jgi:hypothetical protein
MVSAGASRQELARTLNAAYADGLLSANTLSHRLDQVFGSLLVDPWRLVGDLTQRASRRGGWRSIGSALGSLVAAIKGRPSASAGDPLLLLALDWTGGDELLIGRHLACDVVLSNAQVSRQHARLLFRDGRWILHDLASLNGTTVNGARVGRCELRPGDHVLIGGHHLKVD